MTVNRKKNNRQMHRNCVSYLKFFLFFAPTCFGWNSRNMSVRWIKHFKKRYAIPVHLLVIFSCINFLSCLCIFVLQDISWPSNIIMFLLILYHGWTKKLGILYYIYKVVQIWPGLIVCKQVTVCPSHIWTTLYNALDFGGCFVTLLLYSWYLYCTPWSDRNM